MAAPNGVGSGTRVWAGQSRPVDQPVIDDKPVKQDKPTNVRAPSTASSYAYKPLRLTFGQKQQIDNEEKQLVTGLLDELLGPNYTTGAIASLGKCLDRWKGAAPDEDDRAPVAFLTRLDAALRSRSSYEIQFLRERLKALSSGATAHEQTLEAMLQILDAVDKKESGIAASAATQTSRFAGYAAGADGAAMPVPASQSLTQATGTAEETPFTAFQKVLKIEAEKANSTRLGGLYYDL